VTARCFLIPGLALAWLGAAAGRAETIRVATWNLQPTAAEGSSRVGVAETAAVLKRLAPDVILLQRVPDWQACAELAGALKPAHYQVAICSAFRSEPGGSLSRQQVAVLSRRQPYFSWSEPWPTAAGAPGAGGFAFAAFNVGGRRVGLWSVDAGHAAVSIGPLLEHVGSVRHWITNRAEALVIAGAFAAVKPGPAGRRTDGLKLLAEAGFADVAIEVAAGERIVSGSPGGRPGAVRDYVFTQPAGAGSPVRVRNSDGPGPGPVVCEVELDPGKIAAQRPAPAGAASAQSAPASPGGGQSTGASAAAASASSASGFRWMAAGVVVGLVVLVAAARAWTRRERRRLESRGKVRVDAPGVQPPASLYSLVVATRSGTGSADHGAGGGALDRPVVEVESLAATQTQAEVLGQRVRAAEQRADAAAAAVRAGVIGQMSQWLKEKLVRRLISDRAGLLASQERAATQADGVEARLARIEQQIQEQNRLYQQQVAELNRQLAAAKEENRDLIRAQILRARIEMEAARARLLAQAKAGPAEAGTAD
jgi:hypothetical protein